MIDKTLDLELKWLYDEKEACMPYCTPEEKKDLVMGTSRIVIQKIKEQVLDDSWDTYLSKEDFDE